jgi:galactose mutarotase-like enzyme
MWDEAEIVTDVDLPVTIEGNGFIKKGSGIKFSRISDNMDEGFPGKIKVETQYLLTSDNEMHLTWKAWLVEG